MVIMKTVGFQKQRFSKGSQYHNIEKGGTIVMCLNERRSEDISICGQM